jgi:hypothetical protein
MNILQTSECKEIQHLLPISEGNIYYIDRTRLVGDQPANNYYDKHFIAIKITNVTLGGISFVGLDKDMQESGSHKFTFTGGGFGYLYREGKVLEKTTIGYPRLFILE